MVDRLLKIVVMVMVALKVPSALAHPHDVDVSALRDLPVLDGGRVKPVDTLARETVRFVTGKEKFARPGMAEDGTQEVTNGIDALSLLLHWGNPAEKWEEAAVLYVPRIEVRGKVGMKEASKWIAPAELRGREGFWEEVRAIEQKVVEAEREWEVVKLSAVEEGTRDLKLRLEYFDAAVKGSLYKVVPEPGKSDRWVALSRFLEGSIADGAAVKLAGAWGKVVGAFQRDDQKGFDEGVVALKREIVGLAGPGYADFSAMKREVLYNRVHPFRLAWVAYFLSLGVWIVAAMSKSRRVYWVAVGVFVGAIGVNVLGFVMRCRITGWAPVTNMYETIVWVAMTGAVFSLVMELIYRRRVIGIGGAVVAVLACVVADAMPGNLGRQFTPLTAVLRSNLWLTVHVLTIVSSYAAFALALVLGNVALWQFVKKGSGVRVQGSGKNRSDDILNPEPRTLNPLSDTLAFTYRSIQIGVLLIAAGTILGGLWADISWGRFWGWDPKEVWALIVLLVYLALLHGRYAGWIGQFGLAAGAVLCFTAVVMSWYGVNFVLGAGLHSYGFGSGGQGYVFPIVMLQWVYVGVSWVLYKRKRLGSMGGVAERVHAAVVVGEK